MSALLAFNEDCGTAWWQVQQDCAVLVLNINKHNQHLNALQLPTGVLIY